MLTLVSGPFGDQAFGVATQGDVLHDWVRKEGAEVDKVRVEMRPEAGIGNGLMVVAEA